ncbi:MAG TPA: flagellar biosynthesis protein FlhB [Solirubrobacteraceae bacterium]|nr:flagellar biosynthesis protein FlhB [Solirubrobacteraceae bacterium]
MAGGGERTEKATPKKRLEARQKGQVARSMDLNGAIVLLAALLALSAFAPGMYHRMADASRQLLVWTAQPEIVGDDGLGKVFSSVGTAWLLSVLPIAAACLVAGVLTSLVQVGVQPSPQALKPDMKRLNPLTGAKQIFGTHALFEGVKSTVKVLAVGAIATLAVLPKLEELAALVGMPPAVLLPELCRQVLGIAQRCAFAYLVIAIADVVYQRWRHEKQLKMDKQDVKEEYEQQQLPNEVRSAQRRRATELAGARMMDEVPTADVVVTNPTHYSVALRYSADALAPVVVAKGQDLVAFRIREIARDAGVPVVPDPPLARAIHGTVDVGRMIPEELFQAVAELLAYVYRVAGKQAA